MTYEKLKKGNDYSQRIKELQEELLSIEKLLKNAQTTPIYEDGPSHKLSMEIKPVGWTGPRISNFSFQFVEKVLEEYRAGLETELNMTVKALEAL